MNDQNKPSKELQHQGVEVLNNASNELFSDWKPKTRFGRISKWFAKLAVSIGVGITKKNIDKQ